jgi:alkanesulfonate monooxygenase SsuD/methylene tetrahydromethanopterin reductase-like flavin-dependent oxidoreductase (luciferase family)
LSAAGPGSDHTRSVVAQVLSGQCWLISMVALYRSCCGFRHIIVADLPWVIALDSRAEILLGYDLPFCDRILQLSGTRNPTVRDFKHHTGRERLENPWASSPKDIADRLEKWFTERACNGLVVDRIYSPGTFEEFVWLVIPKLQRRGVYRNHTAGSSRAGAP